MTAAPHELVAPYELTHTPTGVTARVRTRGPAVLGASTLNRGTAFTLAQREALGLTGLLPTGVSDLESQHRRVYAQYQAQGSNLRKWVLLTNLRDRNEVLYYKLLSEHLAEMLPVIYTPTVGQAIERFSQEFRRTRGVYLSIDHPDQIETALRNTGLGPNDVDVLVATDSEGILGIGDQGVGGIEISIGKLAIYTAAGGIHPRRTLPVVLDVGTDNLTLLNDPLYLGERHARVRDHRYDEFLDAFVAAVRNVFPRAMLHWEDFAADNARRVLHRYTQTICSFNDDLQGTAAVTGSGAHGARRRLDRAGHPARPRRSGLHRVEVAVDRGGHAVGGRGRERIPGPWPGPLAAVTSPEPGGNAMFRSLVGFAVGYVLGARAGRARYDQIAALVQRVADHPAVQGAAGFLHAKVSGLLHTGPPVRRPDPAYLDWADSEPNTSARPGDQALGQRAPVPTVGLAKQRDDRPLHNRTHSSLTITDPVNGGPPTPSRTPAGHPVEKPMA